MLKRQNSPDELSRRSSGAAKAFGVRLFLFVVVYLAAFLGVLEPLNMSLMDMRFKLLKRQPSETLVIVEIDPYSLQQESRWPWPRDRYGAVIANLQEAGASLIAFDVDFSARSDKVGDAAFVEALTQRPGEVILPIFYQKSFYGAKKGEMIQTPPNPLFLRDAVVASVNLTTEKNGLVRQGWLGFEDDQDQFRASIAAVLAGFPAIKQETFYIDYSIDQTRIDHLSFSDVLKGDFDREVVAGKKVLIGATALELGDEFAAPIWGLTPGVMFHALSYESILQQRTLKRLHYCIPLIIAFAVIFWLCRRGTNRSLKRTAVRHLSLLGVLLCAPILIQYLTPVSVDVGAVLAAQILCALYVTARSLNHYARQIIRQRAQTARYQALTDLVVQDNADGVIVANAQGVIELCNGRASKLLDAQAMEPGVNIREYAENFPLYPSTGLSALHSIEGNKDRRAIHSEYIVENGDGLILEIVANCASPDSVNVVEADTAGRTLLFVYTLRDISARKRVEEAELAAKEAAIAADKLKSELISNMSHELRTPLNGVIGFADILQKESLGPIGIPQYQEYSENIYLSGKRLLNLVNDMLNIAKLDADGYELYKDAMSVNEVIEHCLSTFESRTRQDISHITLEIQKDLPMCSMDLSVFNEIFCHLLSNAIKYTKDDAQIFLRVMQNDDGLLIELEDNGCGVGPEHLPKLTEAFYQADGALTRQHEGAGLGLYLVSKFVALHDGALELESREGEGFLARLRFADMVAKAPQKVA